MSGIGTLAAGGPCVDEWTRPVRRSTRRNALALGVVAFATLTLGTLASPGDAAAADLVILTNQGATPGVRELGTAFSRATGHTVTVVQVGKARRSTAGLLPMRRAISSPAIRGRSPNWCVRAR